MTNPRDLMDMEEIVAAQNALARLAIDAHAIDFERFKNTVLMAASPEALVGGLDPRIVVGAGRWVDIIEALEPFWRHCQQYNYPGR